MLVVPAPVVLPNRPNWGHLRWLPRWTKTSSSEWWEWCRAPLRSPMGALLAWSNSSRQRRGSGELKSIYSWAAWLRGSHVPAMAEMLQLTQQSTSACLQHPFALKHWTTKITPNLTRPWNRCWSSYDWHSLWQSRFTRTITP